MTSTLKMVVAIILFGISACAQTWFKRMRQVRAFGKEETEQMDRYQGSQVAAANGILCRYVSMRIYKDAIQKLNPHIEDIFNEARTKIEAKCNINRGLSPTESVALLKYTALARDKISTMIEHWVLHYEEAMNMRISILYELEDILDMPAYRIDEYVDAKYMLDS